LIAVNIAKPLELFDCPELMQPRLPLPRLRISRACEKFLLVLVQSGSLWPGLWRRRAHVGSIVPPRWGARKLWKITPRKTEVIPILILSDPWLSSRGARWT